MSDFLISLFSFIVSLFLLITWIIVVFQVIAIKRSINKNNQYQKAIDEIAIAKLSGNKLAELEQYYRAMYFFWNEHKKPTFTINELEQLRLEMQTRYKAKVEDLGGVYPNEFKTKAKQIDDLNYLHKTGRIDDIEYKKRLSKLS